MMLALFLVFVVAPLVELYVIIQVAQSIGGWQTIGLLIIDSLLGAWLMKQQGRAVLRRIQTQLEQYKLPGKDLVDGGLILFAGALMLTPGFVTDILGFLLLIPPTRAVFRKMVMATFLTKRLGKGFVILKGGARMVGFDPFGQPGPDEAAGVFDTTAHEQNRPSTPPQQGLPRP